MGDTSAYSNPADECEEMTQSKRYRSYRANPGSIWDYDPTEIETEYEEEKRSRRRPKNRKAKFSDSQDNQDAHDLDFSNLLNYQNNDSLRNNNSTARNWMEYLQGEFKPVAPVNDVNRHRNVLEEAETLVNISKEQVNKAREAAALQAKKDEQTCMANMYAKQADAKVREIQNANVAQSEVASTIAKSQTGFSRSITRDTRLNLSSYGYTTDYMTDYSESCLEQTEAENETDSYKLNTFMAMYNYNKQEEDELSFEEGDYLEDCQFIGEGWLYGYNRRTGESGMLPANYVESASI